MFRAGTKAEILASQPDKLKISAKTINGEPTQAWEALPNLTNFRYLAWYSGSKSDFIAAKKLASIANKIYDASGQDIYISGIFDITEIKKLITQFSDYADYWDKNHRDR